MQIGSSQEETLTIKLMQKLMAKARVKANELARLSGKKITNVVSVSDKRNDQPNYPLNSLGLINTLGIDRQKGMGDLMIVTLPALPDRRIGLCEA
jgi:hypothetical protein